jgi:hypothetical protein
LQKEQLAPFYVERSLVNYPGATPLDGLTAGMDALARTLTPGSPATLFCLQRVCDRCLALTEDPKAAMGLVHLLAYLLLVIDLQVSPLPPDSPAFLEFRVVAPTFLLQFSTKCLYLTSSSPPLPHRH